MMASGELLIADVGYADAEPILITDEDLFMRDFWMRVPVDLSDFVMDIAIMRLCGALESELV